VKNFQKLNLATPSLMLICVSGMGVADEKTAIQSKSFNILF